VSLPTKNLLISLLVDMAVTSTDGAAAVAHANQQRGQQHHAGRSARAHLLVQVSLTVGTKQALEGCFMRCMKPGMLHQRTASAPAVLTIAGHVDLKRE
jgi:hypothetical protein